MKMKKTTAFLIPMLLFIAFPGLGMEPVKIGMITTLSTGGGYLGEDIRDGFNLALSAENGKLGGIPVTLLVEDDGRKPGKGKQIAERYLKKHGIQILTGIVFSNVAMAVVPDVVDSGAFYISANAAPSALAGKMCRKNYFVVSWQNDNSHEAAGALASQKGFKRAFIAAPNYAAGKDALKGFKRMFSGEIVGEIYTKLGQSDYAAELARIRAAKPDVVFHFLPGGMGINFLKQYVQSGLKKNIPLVVSAFSMDNNLMKAVGDAGVGVFNTPHWSEQLENRANKEFVGGYLKAYKRLPTIYASQGYDAAKLIGSALKAVNGDINQTDAFRKALKQAAFESVRGKFSFSKNNHPVQDWYARQVVKQKDGVYVNKLIGKVLKDRSNAYNDLCR